MTALTEFQWDIFVQQIVAGAFGCGFALTAQAIYRKWPRGKRP